MLIEIPSKRILFLLFHKVHSNSECEIVNSASVRKHRVPAETNKRDGQERWEGDREALLARSPAGGHFGPSVEPLPNGLPLQHPDPPLSLFVIDVSVCVHMIV